MLTTDLFPEILLERVRSFSLYHATNAFNAVHIITQNRFAGKTQHYLPNIGLASGVSFTRNFQFAREWSFIVFEVDRLRLAQRYRLFPFNYWGFSKERNLATGRSEAEEFVVGNVGPANRYITGIYISTSQLHRLQDVSDRRSDGFYDPLLNHPLLFELKDSQKQVAEPEPEAIEGYE